jgi:hypothetical protein
VKLDWRRRGSPSNEGSRLFAGDDGLNGAPACTGPETELGGARRAINLMEALRRSITEDKKAKALRPKVCPFHHTTKTKSARPTVVTFETICSRNRPRAWAP